MRPDCDKICKDYANKCYDRTEDYIGKWTDRLIHWGNEYASSTQRFDGG